MSDVFRTVTVPLHQNPLRNDLAFIVLPLQPKRKALGATCLSVLASTETKVVKNTIDVRSRRWPTKVLTCANMRPCVSVWSETKYKVS